MSIQDLADLEAYRAALRDVNAYIAQEENIVSNKLETTSRFANPQEEYKNSKVRNVHLDTESREKLLVEGFRIHLFREMLSVKAYATIPKGFLVNGCVRLSDRISLCFRPQEKNL